MYDRNVAAILFGEAGEGNDSLQDLRGDSWGAIWGTTRTRRREIPVPRAFLTPLHAAVARTLSQHNQPSGGLGRRGKGGKKLPRQALTPISHPTRFTSPRIGKGGGGGSASCHSPSPLSGAGVSNKGSFRLASSRRMFTRRSDEKLSPNAVL